MAEHPTTPRRRVKKNPESPKTTADLKQPVQPDDNAPAVVAERSDDIAMPISTVTLGSRDVTDAFPFKVAFNIAFVGVGEAGGRIANTFYELGYRRVCAINGAEEIVELSEGIRKLHLQTGGAGKDPERGANQVSRRDEEIFDLFTRTLGKSSDYIVVCAGLGGGTGGGAAPKVIEVARKYMEEHGHSANRVGAIVTLPHHDEGYTPCRNAVNCFYRIHKMGVTPLFIIDNLRIGELAPDARKGAGKLYQFANEQVAKLFHLFNRLVAQRSSILTFDRADFASLLDSGICVFGASPIPAYESPADVSSAIRDQLAKTVLAEVDLRSGKKAGCLFVGSQEILDKVPMEFFGGGFGMLTRILAEGSVVHRGIYQGSSPDLRCYTMLAELPPPTERLKKLAQEGDVTVGGMAQYLGVE